MPELQALLGTLRLGPLAALRLAGWKAYQSGVRRRELRTGHAACETASARFAADWRERWATAGVQAWLQRAGAGQLHLEPREAAAWCRATCTAQDLALASASAGGVFDLIGSGPRDLGRPPRWRTDLYTGAEWPLEDAHRLRIIRGDGSDIRTVWELSRCYHFIALARAYWSSGDARFAHAFIAHVDSWIEQNPFGRGPHWASPMDAAIRGANWTLGLLLFAGAPELDAAFAGRMLSNLYATALHVERHREWHPVYRGNHYVANGVGLAYLGALFRDDPRGARWLRRGTRIIADELLRQVHPDGVSFEASIGYHRLAAQLFGWGAEIVRRNAPERWTQAHETRLAAMYDFIEAYTPASGLAPMLGDADDGHLHVMDARMLRDPRRHQLGLPPRSDSAAMARAEPASRLYADGGFAVLRHGEDHCTVRCGPVGLLGAGSHDHNDQLSFELVIRGQRVVRDSGTFCYTRDLAQRYRFRATAAHNALQLGGAEQNPIRPDRPWRVLQDRTRARVTDWSANDHEIVFAGEHLGYTHRTGRPRVRREIRYLAGEATWVVTDSVVVDAAGVEAEEVAWHLHLDPAAELMERGEGSARVTVGDVVITLAFPAGLEPTLEVTDSSDRYGESVGRPVVRLTGRAALPVRIVTRIR